MRDILIIIFIVTNELNSAFYSWVVNLKRFSDALVKFNGLPSHPQQSPMGLAFSDNISISYWPVIIELTSSSICSWTEYGEVDERCWSDARETKKWAKLSHLSRYISMSWVVSFGNDIFKYQGSLLPSWIQSFRNTLQNLFPDLVLTAEGQCL